MIKCFDSVFSKSLIMFFYVGIPLFFWLGQLDAQTLRDPTLPPPIRPELDRSAKKSGAGGSDKGSLTIIVRDGRRYVVLGTRLYAQGQKFGDMRIERITETEVWFLENGVLRKLSRFPDVQRRPVTLIKPQTSCPTSHQKSSGSGLCADLLPQTVTQ